MNNNDTAAVEKAIADTLLHANDSSSEPDLIIKLRMLRNLSARGAHNQQAVAASSGLQNLLNLLLFQTERVPPPQETKTVALQLLANTIVNNAETQKLIWQHHGQHIIECCSTAPLGTHTDIMLMLVHNIMKGGSSCLSRQQALQTAIRVWQLILKEKNDAAFEFLHFIYEDFLVCDGRSTVQCYAHLQLDERIDLLDYLASYLRQDSPNGLVHSFLLQYLSKEFKIKSDCVLRHTTSLDAIQPTAAHPREAYNLLRVIASASGSEKYTEQYAKDHSLFLNASSMLRCLVASGKAEPNPGSPFAPMNKLEQVALTSNIPTEFEQEISYELKTLLVRCVANLLYKNPTNQCYCLDTQLIPALLECTNVDARNPLMREWSILAIRNACIGCPENQEVIAGLTRQGNAPNNMLQELNIEMGSLRIKPNAE